MGPEAAANRGEVGVGCHRAYCVCEAREQGPALMNRSGLVEDLF